MGIFSTAADLSTMPREVPSTVPPLAVDVVYKVGRQPDRGLAARRIESRIAATETEHLWHAVSVVQLVEQRTDDVIQAGAQPTAGNNSCPGPRGIEEQFGARSGQLEPPLLPWLQQTPDDVLRHEAIVADETTQGRGVAGFPQCCYSVEHGLAFQISLAYSAMVRSLENLPEAAMFRVALRVHSSRSAYNSPKC